MTTVQMRKQISDIYNTPNWKKRVACMSEGQVIAIFFRFVNTNKFSNKPEPIKMAQEEPTEQIHQMTLFECGLKGAYCE